MITAQLFSIPMPKITSHDQNIMNIPEIIQKELTKKEILAIDMRLIGTIILEQAKALSSRVDHELLKPISVWPNDSDWMEKFQGLDSERPDWAQYKRRSRQWTKQQRYLATERLKRYWQKIRKKRQYRKAISQVLYTNEENRNFKDEKPHNPSVNTEFLLDILAPFSPIEKHRAKIAFEFNQACKFSVSDLLPWKTIIISELTEAGSTTFDALKTYITKNKKLEKISKFQHLLQLDSDGEVSLEQFEHTGQIQIIRKSANQKPPICIKDKSGQSYNFDWSSLNDAQKNKIVNDAIERRILCRSVSYE